MRKPWLLTTLLVFVWAVRVLAQPVTSQPSPGVSPKTPIRSGTSAQTPSTCVASKELWIKTDATPGQQIFICNAAGNGFVLVGDGGATGTVTSVGTGSGLTGGPVTTTGTVSCLTASGAQFGCLAAADWTTFNAKQAPGNYLVDPGSSGLLLRTGLNTTSTYGGTTCPNQFIRALNGSGVATCVDIPDPFLPQSTVAGLPTAGTTARIRRLTDQSAAGTLVVDDGTDWTCQGEKADRVFNPVCPPYNVKTDESADAAAGINLAISHMPASGGVLLLPVGAYRLDSVVTLNKSMTVRGAGMAVTILKVNYSTANPGLSIASSYVDVRDLSLSTTAGVGVARKSVVNANGVNNTGNPLANMTNVFVEKHSIGIYTTGAGNIYTNVISTNNGSHGFYSFGANSQFFLWAEANGNTGDGFRIDATIGSPSIGAHFSHVIAASNAGIALHLGSWAFDIEIVGAELSGNTGGSVVLDGNPSYAITLTSCFDETAGADGVYIGANVRDVILSNINQIGAQKVGLRILGTKVTVSGGAFIGNGQNGADPDRAGIYVSGAEVVLNGVIAANDATVAPGNTQQYGIKFVGSPVVSIIGGRFITNAVAASTGAVGTGSSIWAALGLTPQLGDGAATLQTGTGKGVFDTAPTFATTINVMGGYVLNGTPGTTHTYTMCASGACATTCTIITMGGIITGGTC